VDEPEGTRRVTPKFESLAPAFSPEQHGVYIEILRRAIDEQPDVRNIALAGAYGTGKSSVLRKIAEEYPGRVVEISVPSLGVEPAPVVPGADSNPAAGTTTNRIQKEIVKQLLYRQSPSKAPQSRFHRIARLRTSSEVVVALIVGVLALAVLVVAGLDVPVLERLGFTLPVPDLSRALRSVVSWVVVVGAAWLVVLLARLLLHGRLRIETVTAGPATITLPPRSSSYFDEYLDEIVYYFQTNPKIDIVVLEDLDRFDDPHIFESLRSLNRLLNGVPTDHSWTEQVVTAASRVLRCDPQPRRRSIRFVYAVKDSAFENLGRDEKLAVSDECRAELVRANRTKFFELVVPVVPFITHKNARDLLHARLRSRGHELSKDLVSLAGRYVADMRLVHNIVNEYEVFRDRLLDVPDPVHGLDAERLFAMVLYKNMHVGDFEDIRLGTSSLDRLHETWRALVGQNLRRLHSESASLRTRIERQTGADEHAADLAKRFRDLVQALVDAPGIAVNGTVAVDGSPVSDELETAAFWRELVANNGSISLRLTSPRPNAPSDVTLSVRVLEKLLGSVLDTEHWHARSIDTDEAALRRNQADADFLRRHTWKVERARRAARVHLRP